MGGISFSDVSVTTSSGAAGTGLTLNVPTNAQVGDLLVAWVSSVSATTITTSPPTVSSTPSGWTNEGFAGAFGASAQSRLTVLARVHTSGTTWSGTFSATAYWVAHVVAYTGASLSGFGSTLSLPSTTASGATEATQSMTVKTAGVDWMSAAWCTAYVSTGSWTQSLGTQRAAAADGAGSIWVYQGVGDSGGPAAAAWVSTGTSSNTTTDRVAGSAQLRGSRITTRPVNQTVNRSNQY